MMRRNGAWVVLVLGALALLATAGCGAVSVGASRSVSEARSSWTMADRTDEEALVFDVSDGMRTARLDVTARLSGGSIEMALCDPDGNVRWRGFADDGRRLRAAQRLEPVPGGWRLRVGLDDATGRVDIHWRAGGCVTT